MDDDNDARYLVDDPVPDGPGAGEDVDERELHDVARPAASVPTDDLIVENVDRVREHISRRTNAPVARATLRDLANSLGISQSTALQALRGEPQVSAKMQTRVRESAEALNFPVRSIAPAGQLNGTVAILTNTMRNPIISDLVRAVRIELTVSGYAAMVVPTRQRVPEVPVVLDAEALHAIKSLGVAGYIMLSDLTDIDQALEIIGDAPVVGASVSSYMVGRADTVRIDEDRAMDLVVEHLAEQGHTDIAHVGGVGSLLAHERAKAFEAAMERRGLAETSRIEPGDFDERVGRSAASMLLRGARIPTAVVAANDPSAMGVLAALAHAGWNVPTDMAVAGYGNTTLASSELTSMTSIDPNSQRVGALAAQFLEEQIAGSDPGEEDVKVTPSLVVRRSTQAGPGARKPRKRITLD
jgi:DNA-binding LacI/PurR family transcriptional regulator